MGAFPGSSTGRASGCQAGSVPTERRDGKAGEFRGPYLFRHPAADTGILSEAPVTPRGTVQRLDREVVLRSTRPGEAPAPYRRPAEAAHGDEIVRAPWKRGGPRNHEVAGSSPARGANSRNGRRGQPRRPCGFQEPPPRVESKGLADGRGVLFDGRPGPSRAGSVHRGPRHRALALPEHPIPSACAFDLGEGVLACRVRSNSGHRGGPGASHRVTRIAPAGR
jgi:hypothetical protein